MKRQEIINKKRRDAEGYARHPQNSEEIEEWEKEQDWADDEIDMSNNFKEILNAALQLPPGKRAELADYLLISVDEADQKAIDAAWAEEIERRMRDLDEGRVEAVDGELVMERLRSRYKSGKH